MACAGGWRTDVDGRRSIASSRAAPASAAGDGRTSDAALQAVWVFRVPARRDADVGQAEQALDGGPFAEVVAFGAMADPLKEVAEYEGAQAPVPGHGPQAH